MPTTASANTELPPNTTKGSITPSPGSESNTRHRKLNTPMLTISWAIDLRDRAGRSRSAGTTGAAGATGAAAAPEGSSRGRSLSMREVSTSSSTNDMTGNTKNARNPRSPTTSAMSKAMTTAVAG